MCRNVLSCVFDKTRVDYRRRLKKGIFLNVILDKSGFVLYTLRLKWKLKVNKYMIRRE